MRFRAWDKVANEMCHVSELSFNGDGIVWGINDVPFVESNGEDGYILMQYTGLEDKNGVEIYEGDIIKHSGNEHERDFPVTQVIFIQSNCLTCHGFFSLAPNGKAAKHTHVQHVEVIGNIYESPELLKTV